MSERIIIVGGVAAGTSVAARAKRARPDLEIVLYQREQFVAYSACGLPYFIAGQVKDHNDLVARTPTKFAEQGIDIRLGHEVLGIDPSAGKVTVRDHARGQTFQDHYDHLVLATGASVFYPAVDGIQLAGVFKLRSMADGLMVKEYLDTHNPRSAVVVGAGYIGLEMAEAFLERGLKVTLMDMAPHALRTLDPDMAMLVEREMELAGVQLRLSAKLEALNSRPDGRVCCVSSAGESLDGEIVLLATGVKPSVQLAEAVGVRCGPRGAIEIDGLGRTNVERIYAAGDCCTVFNRVLNVQSYMPLGTTANKQGRTLGAYLGGIERPFAGVVGSAVTKFNDLHIASTGVTENDARLAGFNVRSVKVESTDHAGYYPGAKPLYVKMVIDGDSRRLLGCQIIGSKDVAKRADIVAVALASQMTVDDFAWSDLTYAPPFSSVWDPVLVAAQKLTNEP